MSAIEDERVSDEVAALEAILMHDVEVKRVNQVPHSIEITIYPSTGNITEKQYVRVTLEVLLSAGYPDRSPAVFLRNPRGLGDSLLDTLDAQINMKLERCLGQPVVFELIELIRDNLTQCNQPTGQCAICLGDFASTDAFSKTNCYHYFHSYCLGKHVVIGEQIYNEELDKLPQWQRLQEPPYRQTCPVCRSIIDCDVESMKRAPPPVDYMVVDSFQVSPELEALQSKMANLLAKQVAKGGVVCPGDNGPRPLTITTPEDLANFEAAAANASAARARQAILAQQKAAAKPAPKKKAADDEPESPKGRIRYRRGKHGRGRGHHHKGGSR